jgi:hypothetical protein
MKILFVVLFATFALFAHSKETCYTVQLASSSNSEKNLALLKKNSYPQSCELMQIDASLTVRCGCFEQQSLAKVEQKLLKKDYENATVVTTYKYRFDKQRLYVNREEEKKLLIIEKESKNELLVTREDDNISSMQDRNFSQKQPVSAVNYLFEEEANARAKNAQKEREKFENSSAESNSTDYIDLTLLGRYVSNETFFTQSPYAFVLFDTEYHFERWKIAAGVYGRKTEANTEPPINHLYAEYFGDTFHFKIGKMVEKIGVMDYFSLLDTLNPVRLDFFDDPNINIKRVPLWMLHVDYYPLDTLKLALYIQPFDSVHQDYTGHYVAYVLNEFIPQHYEEVFQQESLGQEIFSPLYTNAISPFLSQDIESKQPSSAMKLENTSVGFCAEYSDESKKMGFVYFNRYTEIPLIQVDENLLNVAIHYENGESVSEDFIDYLASGDYNPIKSVQAFRYNQLGVYAETTAGAYGLRAEAGHRDKVPLLNNYGSVSSLGLAVDHIESSIYYALETQYIHLSRYNKESVIAMFTTRLEPTVLYSLRGYFENRLIGAFIDTANDAAINPSYTIEYDQTSLIFQGIASKKNSETNSISILLRSVF